MFNTSETIKDLEIPEGRRLLHDFYHDRRIKHAIELRTVLDCWKLCRNGREIQFSDGRRVRFETNLGFKLGTRIFFEEIVGRHYYNFIQGLVYGGAMLVLLAVSLYLAGYSLVFAIAAFAIEALLLLLLAVATAYSPNDDLTGANGTGASEGLLSSINSTVREMTNAVSDLFRLISQADIRQDVLLTRLTEHFSKTNAENLRQYSEKLDETNGLLRLFLETTYHNQAELSRQQVVALQETRQTLDQLVERFGVGSPSDERAADSAAVRAGVASAQDRG